MKRLFWIWQRLLQALHENPGTITGSENRLNNKHISPFQETSQWPNTPKESSSGMQRGCICNNGWTWKALFKEKEHENKNLLNWKE
jgi:hypothetical protein